MKRRDFGRRMLEVAAILGLRSVGPGILGPAALIGCGASPDDERLGDHLAAQADANERGRFAASARSVVIIGSGYGSAVTALRLTERGIPVTLFEMGRLWNTPSRDGKIFCTGMSPDGRAMWFKDRMEAVIKQIKVLGLPIPFGFDTPKQAGVIDVSGPAHMRVYRGRGVGGGSLVNMAIMVTPEREVLQRVFPGVDVDALLRTYYPLAKKHLRADQVPEDLLREEAYRYARVGRDMANAAGYQAERLTSGYDYAYMRREVRDEVPKSALGGEAGFGNNYGKSSLDKTYIAEAMGTGLLTIHALHEVQRVRRAPASGYVLNVVERDIDGKILAEKEVQASHLFVGAGSMDTSRLLVRSRARGDLPDLNQAVGTEWGPNSDIFVALDTPLRAPTGALQSTIPGIGIKARTRKGRPILSMVIPFPMGFESFLSFQIVMSETDEAGTFAYDSATNDAVLRWTPEQSAPAVSHARELFDPINARFGSKYSEISLFGGPILGDRATYHPVGGIPLGRATDPYGRIKEYPGMYVVDSALIPRGLAANPALTVTALAERNMQRIVAEDFAD